MHIRVLLLILYVVGSSRLHAQTKSAETGLFKDGDKVNFIGNSITHGGEFHTNILLFYATRFPERNITFYNSGIWGDNASDMLRRLDTDILTNDADWSIIMAGMNDVNRALYAPARRAEPNLEAEKQRHLNNYRNNLEALIQRLQKTDTRILLQKPSIYDQTGDLPAENQLGVNDALQKCTVIIDELAKKYGVQTVDYFTLMQQVNRQLQAADPTATVVSNDRIHPGALGSFVMAYQFLKETGAPALVSRLHLKKGKVEEEQNCTVQEVRQAKGRLSFAIQERSLPFAVAAEAEAALALVPFTQEMNQEVLQVTRLKKGTYTLLIDSTRVGVFTSAELAKGVNLALQQNTPQYQQALRVRQLAEQRRLVQKQLRDIRLVEVRYLPANLWAQDMPALERAMDAILQDLQAKKDARYLGIRNYFESYRKNKPREGQLEKEAAQLMVDIRRESQPVLRTYQLEKKSR
ncbi:SGNH/GDSL hydrolase family protein [Rufibacter ruber]|uniref:SGNH/GDSL hydrolase family protein n=1 Tax=Rufibacter ruber TaxID=1783499 RepID=UPI0008331B9B|nr:SGNH/GDSL hydrolase family protein [Rufibacter ruber]